MASVKFRGVGLNGLTPQRDLGLEGLFFFLTCFFFWRLVFFFGALAWSFLEFLLKIELSRRASSNFHKTSCFFL